MRQILVGHRKILQLRRAKGQRAKPATDRVYTVHCTSSVLEYVRTSTGIQCKYGTSTTQYIVQVSHSTVQVLYSYEFRTGTCRCIQITYCSPINISESSRSTVVQCSQVSQSRRRRQRPAAMPQRFGGLHHYSIRRVSTIHFIASSRESKIPGRNSSV